MPDVSLEEAIRKLKRLIGKSRSFMYKPIQVAEVLRLYREGKITDLENLESYRNLSKHARDEVTRLLFGTVSTSSAKYQDDVFNEHAIPPNVLKALAKCNRDGRIEKYIYEQVYSRYERTMSIREIVDNALRTTGTRSSPFDLKELWNEFDNPELRRSVDKLYEIVTYSILTSLLLNSPYELTVRRKDAHHSNPTLEHYSRLVLCLGHEERFIVPLTLNRAGVANAADRGLDIWGNFGPAIQVKHVSIHDNETGKAIISEIMTEVESKAVILVVRECSKSVYDYLMGTFGPSQNGSLVAILTLKDLLRVYAILCDRSTSAGLGNERSILSELLHQYDREFPQKANWNKIFSRYEGVESFPKSDFQIRLAGC